MTFKIVLISTLAFVLTEAQRGSYAGLQGIGYPGKYNPTGEDTRFPTLGNYAAEYINWLESLPVDLQPFWYINAKALEDLRRFFPTYEQRPNPFIDPEPIGTPMPEPMVSPKTDDVDDSQTNS